MPVSSELCTNQSVARIRNIIWFNDSQRGATIYPKQNIHLAPWITFPATSHVIPFIFTTNDKHYSDDTNLNVYLLIETDVIPSMLIDKNLIMVRVNNDHRHEVEEENKSKLFSIKFLDWTVRKADCLESRFQTVHSVAYEWETICQSCRQHVPTEMLPNQQQTATDPNSM